MNPTMILHWVIWLPFIAAVLAFPENKNKCPEVCKCSRQVTCKSLEFNGLDSDVRHLVLSSPEPIMLGENAFNKPGLTQLDFLQIENTTITSIHPNAFEGLDTLRQMSILNSVLPSLKGLNTTSLSNNLRKLIITKTKVTDFSNLTLDALEEIEISHCNLTEIDDNAFTGMSGLSFINLSNNRLTTFNPKIFVKLQDLVNLQLAHNDIKEIPDGIFSNEAELSTLNLSHNPITKVEIKSVSLIEELILRSCEITEFIGGQNLDILASLDLTRNKISLLPVDTFANMSELEYLYLGHNNLENLDPKIFFSNTRLTKIILDNNSLRKLPKFESQDGNFQTFIFSCNNCLLDDLSDDTFNSFPGIVTLRLSNNNIRTLSDKVFDGLHSLVELDLSYNKIGELTPKTFNNNKALRFLSLQGNLLQELNSECFVNNKVLEHLDVSNCQLKQIWKQPAQNLPSIKIFNVAGNVISKVTKKDLEVTKSLAVLDLADLKLDCTHELLEAIEWLTTHEVVSTIPNKDINQKEKYMYRNEVVVMPSWENLAKNNCQEEKKINIDVIETEYDKVIEDDTDIPTILVPGDTYDEVMQDASTIEDFVNRTTHGYLWPTVVFLFTSLIVLVCTAVILLFLMRKRFTRNAPSITLSHIQILPWSSGPNIKKHSGSVYKPLSEERLTPPTPKVSRYEQVPTNPSVHN